MQFFPEITIGVEMTIIDVKRHHGAIGRDHRDGTIVVEGIAQTNDPPSEEILDAELVQRVEMQDVELVLSQGTKDVGEVLIQENQGAERVLTQEHKNVEPVPIIERRNITKNAMNEREDEGIIAVIAMIQREDKTRGKKSTRLEENMSIFEIFF